MPGDRERIDDLFKKRDHLAKRYSLDKPGNRFNFDILRSRIANHIRNAFGSLNSSRILDIGSGELFWVEEMISFGFNRENCFGSDLLAWRLKEGVKKGRKVKAITCSADRLPFSSNSFDLVSQFTMMTSILDSNSRIDIAEEMIRVLKPGGFILWYDFRFNNPRNRNTRAIEKEEIGRLYGPMNIVLENITLFPKLARIIPESLAPMLKFFYMFPILRTHYLALIGPKGKHED
jgi:ubiquinone/menaquinone biosynthesis C-methylase UbiE